MATPPSSESLSCYVLHSLLLLLLCPFLCTVEGSKTRFHILKIDSVQQLDVCKESPNNVISKDSASLEVIHKYGPCNPHKTSSAPSLAEKLRRDQLRVDTIAQVRKSMNSAPGVSEQKKRLGVPFHRLSKLGVSSDYFVTVSLGTPKKELPLLFDTGSDVIWTQCKPCKGCYKNAPLFDPTKSVSYKHLTCSSLTCQLLQGSCPSSKCGYYTRYVDNSSSEGFYAWETLTLKSSEHTVLIGCAAEVGGESEGESGIIGLDPTPLSFPSQTEKKYNNHFSYCIPSSPASTGYLTFGGNLPKTVKFTPRTSNPLEYDIHMTGISIGGRKPLTDASLFKIPNLLVDSGTDVTRLSNKAYPALRSIFRGIMKEYNPVLKYELFDTCYNFSRYSSVTIPAISLFFKGGVELDIDVSGIMVQVPEHPMMYCLGFAEYGSDDDTSAILGNTQQKTYRIVFDNTKRRIGFAPGGC